MNNPTILTQDQETKNGIEAGQEAMCETRQRMHAQGLGLDYFLERIKYLCEATKPISCIKGKEADGGTVDFVDVPDNQAIAKGVDIGLTLGDYYPDKKIKAQVKHSGSFAAEVIAVLAEEENKE